MTTHRACHLPAANPDHVIFEANRFPQSAQASDRGGTVKNKLLFVTTFAVGVLVGASAHRVLAPNQTSQVQSPPTPTWNDTEEATRKRMNDFQERLNQLEKAHPDSVETVVKEMEAQRGIEDILIKYREAQLAKFAPFIGVGGTLVTAMITGIGGWLIARLSSKTKP
jgi:hypothetical protein